MPWALTGYWRYSFDNRGIHSIDRWKQDASRKKLGEVNNRKLGQGFFSGSEMLVQTPSDTLGICCHYLCVLRTLNVSKCIFSSAPNPLQELTLAIFNVEKLTGSNFPPKCWEFVATRCVLRAVNASKYAYSTPPDALAAHTFVVLFAEVVWVNAKMGLSTRSNVGNRAF